MAESPTRGLDAASIAQIWDHFRDRAAGGATVVFFSEDLDELMAEDHLDLYPGGFRKIFEIFSRNRVCSLTAIFIIS